LDFKNYWQNIFLKLGSQKLINATALSGRHRNTEFTFYCATL